jgi:nickel-dependent lactate racemase
MKLVIPYFGRQIPLVIPDGVGIDVLEPNDLVDEGEKSGVSGGDDAGSRLQASIGQVQRAVAQPAGSAPFADFLAGGKKVLVIVNDATRPTPTRIVLDAIGRELEAANANFIVATGAHRAPTEDEYRQIFGRHYEAFRKRCSAHDARDESSLADLGQTRNGTPILLNTSVFEADRVIAIGSVEPHYFAGYTGGRKTFLPGVAGFRTIEANHRLALSDLAQACELARNPVSQDMDDALDLIHVPVFSIMTVLDKDQNLAWCSAGDIRASFDEAVRKADAIFTVPFAAKADLVISVAKFPMDIDLYQSQKAIDNGSLALKDGGTLILVSSCRDGVGDRTFLELMGSASTPEEALARIGTVYKLGYHKAAKMALIARRASIMAYSELDPGLLAKAFILACPDLQNAVYSILAAAGPGARVAFLPDGTVTVPRLIAPKEGPRA